MAFSFFFLSLLVKADFSEKILKVGISNSFRRKNRKSCDYMKRIAYNLKSKLLISIKKKANSKLLH